VVKVADPTVKVKIDNDTLVIADAGPQEIRLRAGSHRIQAIKDGKAVRDQFVTITRGGKEIVNVDFVPTDASAVAETKHPPDVSAPRSHINQCMTCHSNVRVLRVDESPASQPSACYAQVASGNALKDPALALGSKAARARAIVWSLAFSPDGRQLAIGQQGIDRSPSILRVWDLERRRDVSCFQHPEGFRSIAFSRNGRFLAAGNFDGTLTTLAFDHWNTLHRIEHKGSAINSVVCVSSPSTFAVGDWDGWIRFYEPTGIANGPPLKYPARIWSLAVNPDESMLAVGGDAKTIQIYDLPSRQLKATLAGHSHSVKSLDFSPDGKLLASAGGDTVRVWDTFTWEGSGQHIHHNPEMLCVRFSPDGKLLAVSDGESDLPHYKLLPTAIILWDVASRGDVHWLRGHTNSIWALAFSPDGKTLASGSADQTVKFWDTVAGKLKETIVPGEPSLSATKRVVKEPNVTP
jgi:WD40 repeat protein